MPKVKRKTDSEVNKFKVQRLINAVDDFARDIQSDFERLKNIARSREHQYDWAIGLAKQTIEAGALQPKIHGLLGLHMFLMIEGRGVTKPEKAHIESLVYDIGNILLKLMTDFDNA